MNIEIQMTGREDREGPWKLALAGYPGTGKTMLSSTVHPGENLFLWFPESPIKSVANRFLPHVRLANEINPDGTIRNSVQDQMQVIITNLQMKALNNELKYKAITLDTGDQLFQHMAAARRIKNRGEFGPGDWGWLADAYRGVIQALIDLPLHVIVLYHLTANQDGQDGFMVRELALQGQMKAEAPGWFDVVAAMDTFESLDAEGNPITQRVMLTHSSRLYPWLKDHSGNMPARFPISSNFVGDWDRLYATFVTDGELDAESQQRQVLEVMGEQEKEVKTGAAVPTPKDLRVKKQEKATKNADPAEPEPVIEQAKPDIQPVPPGPTSLPLDPPEAAPEPPAPIPSPEENGEPQEALVEPSAEEVIDEFAMQGVSLQFACHVCGDAVEDEDLRQISQTRFPGKILCRPHFKEALQQAKKG